MQKPHSIKRFRINPVEIAIFSLVSLIFLNSVYTLFYEQGGFKPAALAPMAANPVSENRAPASTFTQSFANHDFKCGDTAEQTITAQKIRLSGPICAAPQDPRWTQVQVTNTANKYDATVFPDRASGRFSTDYIPLVAGKNVIQVTVVFPGGKQSSETLTLVKN